MIKFYNTYQAKSKFFVRKKYTPVVNHHRLLCVTNSYLGSIPVRNELHQVSRGSNSHLISGVTAVVHGYSFELWTQLQGGVSDCNASWEVEMYGEPTGSSTFTVM